MATLLFFAALRDAAGARSTTVEASTVGEALKIASERYGDRFAKVLEICTIVHGNETVPRDQAWSLPLAENDEIALLPPVSGGEDFQMMDVADKDETLREAVAACLVVCSPETRDHLLSAQTPKGDAVGPAKVAGILAAKRVPDLIPLCHPVRTTFADVTVAASGDDSIEVRATIRGRDRTGFEVEALTACSVAALTLYDFGKAEDPRIRIENLRLISKSGGKSGSVVYE